MRPLARNAGGPVRILSSALFEILLSALIAPVQMLIQTRQILDILLGRDSGWQAQTRAGSMPLWAVVLRSHWVHVGLGLVTLVVLARFSPAQLIWLSPILAGLILSPVTSRYSASPVFGRWARMRGLLVTPEERSTPEIIQEAQARVRRLPRPMQGSASILRLTSDADLLARHVSMLPDRPDSPVADRLAEITARAKITNAQSCTEALGFLDPAETEALVCTPELLALWSGLPECHA